MAVFDEDQPARLRRTHQIGEDLSSLSLDELGERIAELQAEIGRIEEAMQAKKASAEHAASFFKR